MLSETRFLPGQYKISEIYSDVSLVIFSLGANVKGLDCVRIKTVACVQNSIHPEISAAMQAHMSKQKTSKSMQKVSSYI